MEKDTDLMKKEEWKSPKINITTSLSQDLWNYAKQENISWNDALAFGIQFLLAEKDPFTYDYPQCELLKKMKFFQKELENLQNQKEAEGFLNNLKGETKQDGEC